MYSGLRFPHIKYRYGTTQIITLQVSICPLGWTVWCGTLDLEKRKGKLDKFMRIVKIDTFSLENTNRDKTQIIFKARIVYTTPRLILPCATIKK